MILIAVSSEPIAKEINMNHGYRTWRWASAMLCLGCGLDSTEQDTGHLVMTSQDIALVYTESDEVMRVEIDLEPWAGESSHDVVVFGHWSNPVQTEVEVEQHYSMAEISNVLTLDLPIEGLGEYNFTLDDLTLDGQSLLASSLQFRSELSYIEPKTTRSVASVTSDHSPTTVAPVSCSCQGENVTIPPGNNTTYYGTECSDRIYGNNNANTIYGGPGGYDYLYGGDVYDTLIIESPCGGFADGRGSANTIIGNSGPDNLRAGSSNNGSDVYGRGGDDWIYGSGGYDYLKGEGGNDTIYGRQGNDKILGGDGNDRLNGETGSDELEGGNGDDRIDGGTFSNSGDVDVCNGGPGIDTFLNCEIITG